MANGDQQFIRGDRQVQTRYRQERPAGGPLNSGARLSSAKALVAAMALCFATSTTAAAALGQRHVSPSDLPDSFICTRSGPYYTGSLDNGIVIEKPANDLIAFERKNKATYKIPSFAALFSFRFLKDASQIELFTVNPNHSVASYVIDLRSGRYVSIQAGTAATGAKLPPVGRLSSGSCQFSWR
jgi:hypothetical protein